MSHFLYWTTLDDAYYFLARVKYSPNIRSSRKSWQRQLRACILFSWIALEEALDGASERLLETGTLQEPLPGTFLGKLKVVLLARGIDRFTDTEFRRLRKLRNELVHPRETLALDETLLTVKQADETFRYCLGLMRAMYPVSILVHELIE